MTGWQVQEMWERDAAAEWERITAPDPCEKQMENAAVGMKDSAKLIDTAENRLINAIRYLRNTPMEDRVNSILNGIMDLRCELEILASKYERGERE